MDRLAPLPSCRCRRRTSTRLILAAPPVISDIPALVIVYFIPDVPSLKDVITRGGRELRPRVD